MERTAMEDTPAQRMEAVIRAYIHACNDADAQAIAKCLSSEAVHYFPSGYGPKWAGSSTIGRNIAKMAQNRQRCWTVDQIIIDVGRCAGAMEWTSFVRQHDRIIRGVDWFLFEPQTFRIREVRSYMAAQIQPDKSRQELGDFDYAGRGYPTMFQ
jgi:hypothetical protein